MSDLENAHGGKDNAGFMDAREDPNPDLGKGDGDGFNAWWEERSLPQKILFGIGMAILGIGLLALFGLIVMLLWNWLMPDIFGLPRVNYWQAWGLQILCWILFKNWGSSSKNGTERKRKRQLRRYMQEDPSSAGPDATPSTDA